MPCPNCPSNTHCSGRVLLASQETPSATDDCALSITVNRIIRVYSGHKQMIFLQKSQKVKVNYTASLEHARNKTDEIIYKCLSSKHECVTYG